MPGLDNIHKNLVWFFLSVFGPERTRPHDYTSWGCMWFDALLFFSINLLVSIHLLTTQVSILWFSYGFGLALPFPKFSFSKSYHTHLPRTNTPTILAYFSSIDLFLCACQPIYLKDPPRWQCCQWWMRTLLHTSGWYFHEHVGNVFWHMSIL